MSIFTHKSTELSGKESNMSPTMLKFPSRLGWDFVLDYLHIELSYKSIIFLSFSPPPPPFFASWGLNHGLLVKNCEVVLCPWNKGLSFRWWYILPVCFPYNPKQAILLFWSSASGMFSLHVQPCSVLFLLKFQVYYW